METKWTFPITLPIIKLYVSHMLRTCGKMEKGTGSEWFLNAQVSLKILLFSNVPSNQYKLWA